jgi:hypothetical protein
MARDRLQRGVASGAIQKKNCQETVAFLDGGRRVVIDEREQKIALDVPDIECWINPQIV